MAEPEMVENDGFLDRDIPEVCNVSDRIRQRLGGQKPKFSFSRRRTGTIVPPAQKDDTVPAFTRKPPTPKKEEPVPVFSRAGKDRIPDPDSGILEMSKAVFANGLTGLDFDAKVATINALRELLHSYSPFASEPVDCVRWVRGDMVDANDYNPNAVAPPEMRLLETSIREDGYTQPIVAWKNGDGYEVVDGFHRNRIGKESTYVRDRIHGYLPITAINVGREERGNRIAATIRHNRARGKHQVGKMSEIVLELKARNWTNERIAKNLGMDEDEILRLCQITGLAGLFSDQEFSKAWDIEDSEPDFAPITDDDLDDGDGEFRTVNTGDKDRIFHTHDKWECFQAGLYATTKDGMTKRQCEEAYQTFLADLPRFSEALGHVITEWKHSCEHYLTNSAMNRIAWLGQASMCYATGVPAVFRGGFYLLSDSQQKEANEMALVYLNKWLIANGRKEVSMMEALSDNQMDLY
uniref:ParB-like N-terminal domain-containing protein n=1 Tax=viral metagenome TaxID=1070528 RepID=A0A6M3IL11_9ZZZZ